MTAAADVAEYSKKCSKCASTKLACEFYADKRTPDRLKSECRSCHNEMNKNWRKENAHKHRSSAAKWRAANTEKRLAHFAVRNALRSGALIKSPCEVCGSGSDVEAHHDSYDESRRLDVRWLCASHHSEWHKSQGREEV